MHIIKKSQIIKSIKKDTKIALDYLLFLTFATVIATLGLLTNSTAVVIGAMLISPLLKPIIGLIVGILDIKDKSARAPLIQLFISIIIALFISSFIAYIYPIKEINNEIATRITPDILHLIIGLASGIVGVINLILPEKSNEGASGVAVAIALLPPLCVTGIGIAYADWNIIYGSFLLFITNVVSILFAGVFTVHTFKILRRSKNSRQRFKISFITLFITTFFLTIPLGAFFYKNIKKIDTESKIKKEITEYTNTTYKNLNVKSISFNEEDTLNIELKMPINRHYPLDYKHRVKKQIIDVYNKEYNVNVEVLNML